MLGSNQFLKNTVILSSGTLIAQALPVLFYPILSRIYSPDDFGLYASVMVISPFITLIASGSYEGAILITRTKQDEHDMIGYILLRSGVVVVSLMTVLFFFDRDILTFLNRTELAGLLYVPVIGSFFIVTYNCFNEYCVKNGYFSELARNKIINTSSISMSKLICGLQNHFHNGLLIGDLLGRFVAAIVLAYRAFVLGNDHFLAINYKRFKDLKYRFNQFPRVMLPDQLLDNLAASVHVFFVGAYFSNEILGFMTMSLSLLYVPVTVITSAIKDVFRKKANEQFLLAGDIRPLFKKLILRIAFVSIPLSVPIYFLLPTAFEIFLGKEWVTAGSYAQILLPIIVMNFVSMSTSGVFVIVQKMRVSLYWQIYSLITTILALVVGVFIYGSIESTLFWFSLSRSSSYLLYSILSYKYAKP